MLGLPRTKLKPGQAQELFTFTGRELGLASPDALPDVLHAVLARVQPQR